MEGNPTGLWLRTSSPPDQPASFVERRQDCSSPPLSLSLSLSLLSLSLSLLSLSLSLSLHSLCHVSEQPGNGRRARGNVFPKHHQPFVFLQRRRVSKDGAGFIAVTIGTDVFGHCPPLIRTARISYLDCAAPVDDLR